MFGMALILLNNSVFANQQNFPEALVRSSENYVRAASSVGFPTGSHRKLFNKALDCQLPVSTGATSNVTVSSILSFSTISPGTDIAWTRKRVYECESSNPNTVVIAALEIIEENFG